MTGHSQGGGVTVSTAALRPEIKAAAAGAPYLCGDMDAIELTDAYPYQEIADFLRMNPDSREQVESTLADIDLRWFPPRVNSTTLLMAGADGSALDAALDPLVQSMPGETEVHKAEHPGYEDGRRNQEWLSRRFGRSEPSLPPHWQG